MRRFFLLSPAWCGGERARLLVSGRGQFELARRLGDGGGAEIGEIFSFLSGLYFRGKLAYARSFARPGRGEAAGSGVFVITANAGLLPAHTRIDLAGLRLLAEGDIDLREAGYRLPLQRDARELARRLGRRGEAVLLGSIATGKYADVLLEELGRRLVFPPAFVGRGDMSRGGLLLRCAAQGVELDYAPLEGAVRHGPRPPRLPPPHRSRA